MDNIFKTNNKTGYFIKNTPESNTKSVGQLEAEEIAAAMKEPGIPVAKDPSQASPFWINGKLILVSSNTTTTIEEAELEKAREEEAEVLVVDYDKSSHKVIKAAELPDEDDEEMSGFAGMFGDLTVMMRDKDGKMIAKKVKDLTPADWKEIKKGVGGVFAAGSSSRSSSGYSSGGSCGGGSCGGYGYSYGGCGGGC